MHNNQGPDGLLCQDLDRKVSSSACQPAQPATYRNGYVRSNISMARFARHVLQVLVVDLNNTGFTLWNLDLLSP